MAKKGWIELSDGEGRYRRDVARILPWDGQPVVFVALGVVYSGTFVGEVDAAGGVFCARSLPDEPFRVLPGEPCLVERWADAK